MRPFEEKNKIWKWDNENVYCCIPLQLLNPIWKPRKAFLWSVIRAKNIAPAKKQLDHSDAEGPGGKRYLKMRRALCSVCAIEKCTISKDDLSAMLRNRRKARRELIFFPQTTWRRLDSRTELPPTSNVQHIFVTNSGDLFTMFKIKSPHFCNFRVDLCWNVTEFCGNFADFLDSENSAKIEMPKIWRKSRNFDKS